jgi:hypothetical protein
VFGAQGGDVPGFTFGGFGGHASAQLGLTPGATLTVVVGGRGGSLDCTDPPPGVGGVNGGAPGGPWPFDGSAVPMARDAEELAGALASTVERPEVAGQAELLEALGRARARPRRSATSSPSSPRAGGRSRRLDVESSRPC